MTPRPKRKDEDFYGFIKYAREISNARLERDAKSLLWFYAWAYNWTESRRSWWPEKKLCAHVGMSLATMHKNRKYLEKHGWIEIVKVGGRLPPQIGVKIGRDDPDYERHSYAKGNLENSLTQEELSKMSPDEVKKYLADNNFSS